MYGYSEGRMKYIKKRQRFENGTKNLTYDPLTNEARSYGHWLFMRKTNDGKAILFNAYQYSHTTGRHVRIVRDHVSNKLGTLPIIEINHNINLTVDNAEQVVYDEYYYDMKLYEYVIFHKEKLTKAQIRKYTQKHTHACIDVYEAAATFNYVKDLRKNHILLDSDAIRDGKSLVQEMEASNLEVAKVRKEKYFLYKHTHQVGRYDAGKCDMHPLYQKSSNNYSVYESKPDVAMLKKEVKTIVKELGTWWLERYWTSKNQRVSIGNIPDGVELVTKDMVPSLARKLVEDEMKEVFNG